MTVNLRAKADELRYKAFKAMSDAGGGHFGGTMSEIEILTVLYFDEMNIDPKNPDMPDRDRFILSKGHGGPGLYTTLAVKGFFPEEKLIELDQNGGMLPKHVDRLKVPGVDVSSGSLGQGLSIANGIALAAKNIDGSDVRIFVLLGDGECDEGQVWEAAMTSSKYKLNNIIAIVDRNKAQVDGLTKDVMPIESLESKWQAFGWQTIAADGHDIESIQSALKKANGANGPAVIIADTVKGKGVSFMEGDYKWHAGSVNEAQSKQGLGELAGRM